MPKEETTEICGNLCRMSHILHVNHQYLKKMFLILLIGEMMDIACRNVYR